MDPLEAGNLSETLVIEEHTSQPQNSRNLQLPLVTIIVGGMRSQLRENVLDFLGFNEPSDTEGPHAFFLE